MVPGQAPIDSGFALEEPPTEEHGGTKPCQSNAGRFRNFHHHKEIRDQFLVTNVGVREKAAVTKRHVPDRYRRNEAEKCGVRIGWSREVRTSPLSSDRVALNDV